MNYVELIENELIHRDELPALKLPENRALLGLYALLVLTRGEEVTLADVHDAWAVARNRTNPDHDALVPFPDLPEELHIRDQKYVDAVGDIRRWADEEGLTSRRRTRL